MSDIIAGRVSLADVQGLRRLRRLLLRRRAGRGRGLGQVDPVQRAGARRVRGVLRARRHLRAGRVQRLPDDVATCTRSFPGARTGRSSSSNRSEQFEARFVMVEVQPTARRSSSAAWRAAACRSRWRTAKAGRCSATKPIAQARGRAALRRQSRRADRDLSAESQRLARRHHRPDHRRRPLHRPDAASGARVPQRAELLAAARLGRGQRAGCACSATRGSGWAEPHAGRRKQKAGPSRVRPCCLQRAALTGRPWPWRAGRRRSSPAPAPACAR